MNISWISLDKHNEKTGEALVPKLQVINNRPICILYNAGNQDPFRNLALETAGFKFSRQGIWVCPVDTLDLAALRAAFPLLEFENAVEPVHTVVEPAKESPNSFLSIMYRNAYETEYAPDLMVKRYEGPLPPAGESCLQWIKENGVQISDTTYRADYAANTNITLTFNRLNRQVTALFHDPEFPTDLDELLSAERGQFDSEIGDTLVHDSKVFVRLQNDLFAPAVKRHTGIVGLTSCAQASPQECIRRTDLDTLSTIMTETELADFHEAQADPKETVVDSTSAEPPTPSETVPAQQGSEQQDQDFNPETLVKISADSIEMLRAQDVERVVEAAYNISEQALQDTYLYLAELRADLSNELTDTFDIIAPFLTDSEIPVLAKLAQDRMPYITGDIYVDQLLSEVDSDFIGKELKHVKDDRWAFVTPDTSESGKFRYTTFDTNGFSGHHVYNTAREAFDAAVKEGQYRTWDLGAIKQLEKAQKEAESAPVRELTPTERDRNINATFNARRFIPQYGLKHDAIRTEKDGKFTAIYFKDHVQPVAYIEGRASKNSVMTALNYNCVFSAENVADIINESLPRALNLREDHAYHFDKKSEVRWVDVNGNTQLSFYVKPAQDVDHAHQVRTEFRIALDGDMPNAILFMKSGEDIFPGSIDLFDNRDKALSFPKADNFEGLVQVMAETFNTIAEEVWSTPLDTTAKAESTNEASHSQQFKTYEKWINENPIASQSTSFIRDVDFDTRLTDEESEGILKLIKSVGQDMDDRFDDILEVMDAIKSARTTEKLQAIKYKVEKHYNASSLMVTSQELAQIRSASNDRKNEIIASTPSSQNKIDSGDVPETRPDIAQVIEPSQAEGSTVVADDNAKPDDDISSHWGLSYVDTTGVKIIDQLLTEAKNHNRDIVWYTVKRERTDDLLIARIEEAQYDVLIDKGAVQRSRSLLDLNIKANQATKIETGETTSVSAQEPATEQDGRRASAGGEYGLNGEWYTGGQFMPASAFTVKGKYTVETSTGENRVLIAPGQYSALPENQRAIFGKIREFTQPTIKGDFTQLERNQHSDSTLVNFFNSIDQFNALLNRYNEGERFYAPEWLMANFSAIPEVQATLPTAPVGSESVTPDTQVNYTAVVRDIGGSPFMVLTKRHGKMQLAEFESGKPVVHSECPVVDADGHSYYFNNEWYENDEIIQKEAPTTNEPESSEPVFYHNEGLSTLVHTIESKLENAKGKQLDSIATALHVALRKKGETNSDRANRFAVILEVIKAHANTDKQTLEADNNKPVLVGIAKALDIHNSNYNKPQVVDAIYAYFQRLGDNYIAANERADLIRQISGQVNRGEFISIELLEAAKGKKALNHLTIYTAGDVQVAMALGDSDIRPKGQRNEKEHFYNAAESFFADPLAVLEAADLMGSEAIEATVKRIRSVENVDMLPTYIASEFKPLLKPLGLPDNIDTDALINELTDALRASEAFDTSPIKSEEVVPLQVEPEVPEGSEYALRETFPDIAERWTLVKSDKVEPFSFELSLMDRVREAKASGVTSFVEAAEYIQEVDPDFFPDNIKTTNPGGAIQAEVTFAWQHVAVLDKKAQEEKKTAPNHSSITVRTTADELRNHWESIQNGTKEITTEDQRIINYIQEALLDGVEDEFIPIARFIDSKYPGYIPESLDSINEFSLIRGEIVSARHYLRMLLEAQNEPDNSAQEKINTPNTQNVVSLHQESIDQSSHQPEPDADHEELIEALSSAGVDVDEMHRLIILGAEVEAAKAANPNVTSLALIKAERELDSAFAEITRKAAAGGVIIDKAGLNTAIHMIKEKLQELTENQDSPWKLSAINVQTMTDEHYVQAGNRIPEDQQIEKALFVAKRLGSDVKERILHNSLDSNPTAEAQSLAETLISAFQDHSRIIELDQAIEGIFGGGSESALTEYKYQELQSLREERAELAYKPSSIELTDDLIEIHRLADSATTASEEIAKKLNIDTDAAFIVIERIREELNNRWVNERTNTDEFKLGLSVLEHLEGFSRQDENEINSIASQLVGPNRFILDIPTVDNDLYTAPIYESTADNTHSSLDSHVFSVSLETSSPAEALAKQINEYVQSRMTVINTSDLPEYGSKLHSGPNGDKLYDLKEINKRLRADFAAAKKAGKLPEDIKLSISKSHSSIAIRIKSLPDSIPMINPEFAAWNENNTHGYMSEAPNRYTEEYRALLMFLEAYADAFNYDDSDRMTDYFSTNFYLRVEADHELADTQMQAALNAYKDSLIEDDSAGEDDSIAKETTQGESGTESKREVEIALPHEAQQAKADQSMLEFTTPVLDLDGNETGWNSIEISSDSLGLTVGGGTLLINPVTLDVIPFESGDRPSNEAFMRAAAYAIDNPLTAKLSREDLEKTALAAVSADMYYDLQDTLEETPDADLLAIVHGEALEAEWEHFNQGTLPPHGRSEIGWVVIGGDGKANPWFTFKPQTPQGQVFSGEKFQLFKEHIFPQISEGLLYEPSTDSENVVTLLPPEQQADKPAQNIARLLTDLNLSKIGFDEDDELHLTVQNEPYMDLTIETQISMVSASNRTLYLTHYFRQNGDSIMDAEMVFEIGRDGRLTLTQTASQNPLRGGEIRGLDTSFGSLFSNNLNSQGFGQGTIIDHNGPETTTRPEAVGNTSEADETTGSTDRSTAPLSEFQNHIDTLGDVERTMLLAYRFDSGRPLETAQEIDNRIDGGTATPKDYAILENLRILFEKKLDSALKKEIINGNSNSEPQRNERSAADDLQSTHTTDDRAHTENSQPKHLADNKQFDDPEEGRADAAGLPREKPATGNAGIPQAGKLPGNSAGVRKGDDPSSDQSDSAYILRTPVSFTPREAILKSEYRTTEQHRESFTDAINTYLRLKQENREPTNEERKQLSTFGGTAMPAITSCFSWQDPGTAGYSLYESLSRLSKEFPDVHKGLKSSTVDSYYTPTMVVEFMWQALERMGINNAKHSLHISDPAVGNGRFLGLAPLDIRETATLTAIEKDPFAAEVTSLCYPEAKVINSGFEDVILPTNSQDIVIGNPPYGDYSVYDPQDKRKRLIHDYFLKRSIELAKPGGIVAFVTSSGTMDKANTALRAKIAASADLVTAYRLPRSVFDNAGAQVVTDILFFQKRHPDQAPADTSWIDTDSITYPSAIEYMDDTVVTINQYYRDNPDHILGELELGKTKFGHGLVVNGSVDTSTFDALLNEIPENIFSATQHRAHRSEEEMKAFEDPRFEDAKIGAYYETENGIFILQPDGLAPHAISGKRRDKISALIQIRDTLLQLLDAEGDSDNETADTQRALLNSQYDAFVKDYGSLNEKANKHLLKRDPSQYLVLALEHKNPENGLYEKSDIFSVAFEELNTSKATVESITDAIAFSLNTKGVISETDIASMLNIDIQDVKTGLEEQCYKNPVTAQWELKAIYLSGNIYDKLEIAENALKFNPEYRRNIEALTEVIPPHIDIDDINVRLGANWVPRSIIFNFLKHKLGASINEDRIRLDYTKETHTWKVSLTQAARRDFTEQNERVHGTPALRFDELMTLTLNQKRARIKDRDGYLDPEQTTLAKAKQQEILEEFSNFIKAEPKYADKIAEAYNRSFNAYREAQYDGSYMTFPGMSHTINGVPLKLREHQPAVIERVLTSEKGVLIAHEAGAGKTIEQIAAAMELKRLGITKKPLVVIPNHMLKQSTNEARDLYPNARILTATPADFDSEGRLIFSSKVRMNDWDLVICTHSMFQRMAVPAEFAITHIEDEIDLYEAAMSDASDNKITLRNLETAKKKLETKLKTTIKKLEEKTDEICFDECGFDALFYDEGHYLKNFAPPTTMSDVAGVNTTTSERSMDAVLKADYIRHKRGDLRGVYLATGTPITNSVTEVWVMIRIVAPSLLKELGIYNFDNFAATFCEVVDHVELKPEGDGYQQKARLSKFHNVPEMIRIFRMIADIKTAEDLNLPTPKATEVKHVAPQSEEMALFMSWLAHRAGLVRDRTVEPSEDNILSIANDGRMASLDMRLLHEGLPDDPSSKLNMCVKNVHDKYIEHAEDRRTQIVFCDRGTPKEGFNLYDDMKKKWISMGIPAGQIAFIHEAKNDEQKEVLFAKVRAGEIRILLGSTEKMGVGTNVQTRGSDLHMLDIPWRPTDLTQRKKRFERQGNLFEGVNIHYYTTEDSFDLFMLETVVRKLKFITQALSNPDKAARKMDEDIDPTLSEIMAITTGNPLIKDKVEVDTKLERLKLLQRAHASQQRNALAEAKWKTDQILPSYENAVADYEMAIENGIPEEFEMTIQGKAFTEPKKAGLAIHSYLNKKIGLGGEIGTFAGYPFVARSHESHISIEWRGPVKVEVNLTKDPARFTTNLLYKLQELPSKVEKLRNKVSEIKTQIDNEMNRANTPYAHEQEVRELQDRQNEINIEISKMCDDSAPPKSEGFIHPFKELLNVLKAKEDILSEDEIAIYSAAISNTDKATGPRVIM